MMKRNTHIDEETWRTVVSQMPIVSVDLVVERGDDIILGRRVNPPAEDEWFVPGGRVHKNETLTAAVSRVGSEELGVDVQIDRRLGVYEHLYTESEFPSVSSKHYIPVGYKVTISETAHFEADSQHSELSAFRTPIATEMLHEYVVTYLADANIELTTA
jgi:ADP-ribose pyrophosphatase